MDADLEVQGTMHGLVVPHGAGSRSKERRGKLEIIVDILNVCKDGALKTEIVYKANLNFKRVDRYIPFLEKRQLLENSGSIYTTTDKGYEFLDNYSQVKELFLT
jgi:predicted transcriptional regulator